MEFLVKIRILGKFLDISGFLDDDVKKNTVVMFMASLGWRLCHMKCQTLLSASCRYRLFERKIICKRDEPLTLSSK